MEQYIKCCCRSVTKSCPTLCNPMDCNMPDFPVFISWSFFKLMSIESVIRSNYLILCFPLLLLPLIFPNIRVFSIESSFQIRWPKYWSFMFSISPFNEYSGLITLELTGLISLKSKELSGVFSSTTIQKYQFFSFLQSPTLTSIHNYWKNHSLD